MNSRSLVIAMIALLSGGCRTEPAAPLPASFKAPRPASDVDLTWRVLSVMNEHVIFYEDEYAYKRSIAPATEGQLAVYACARYLGEVHNGGHDQFFFNSTGMVWEDALQGFRLLNATEHLRILTEAIAVFPGSRPSRDRQARWDQMDDIDGSVFDELDDRLYALNEDFAAIVDRYVLEHPDEFFVTP